MSPRASLWIVVLFGLGAAALVSTSYREESEPRTGFPSAGVIEKAQGAVVEVVEEHGEDLAQRAGLPSNAPQSLSSSAIKAFLEFREVPAVAVLQKDLDELAAEPRDPSWSLEMETRLQSEIAQAGLTLVDSYVECGTSTCLVALVRPTGAYDQKELVGLPNGTFTRKMLDAARTVGLVANPRASQILARNGALVHWQRFYRACVSAPRCSQ